MGADPDVPGDAVAQARIWLAEHGDVVPSSVPEALRGDSEPHAPSSSPAASRSTGGSAASGDALEDDGARGAGGPAAGRKRRSRTDDEDADPVAVARTIVLRKLAAQARTRQELAKALAARQVPEEVANQVLDRMEAVGLVDDAAFAHDWVQSRQQRRHLSKSALRRELQTKGVDRDQIDEAVADVESGDELVAAEALAEKKLRTMSGLAREVQYRRLAGALARRGFGAGVTSTVLGRVLDGPSD